MSAGTGLSCLETRKTCLAKEHRSAYHPCTAKHQVMKRARLTWGRGSGWAEGEVLDRSFLSPLAPFRTLKVLLSVEGPCQLWKDPVSTELSSLTSLRATSVSQNYLLTLASWSSLVQHLTDTGIKRTLLSQSAQQSSTSRPLGLG